MGRIGVYERPPAIDGTTGVWADFTLSLENKPHLPAIEQNRLAPEFNPDYPDRPLDPNPNHRQLIVHGEHDPDRSVLPSRLFGHEFGEDFLGELNIEWTSTRTPQTTVRCEFYGSHLTPSDRVRVGGVAGRPVKREEESDADYATRLGLWRQQNTLEQNTLLVVHLTGSFKYIAFQIGQVTEIEQRLPDREIPVKTYHYAQFVPVAWTGLGSGVTADNVVEKWLTQIYVEFPILFQDNDKVLPEVEIALVDKTNPDFLLMDPNPHDGDDSLTFNDTLTPPREHSIDPVRLSKQDPFSPELFRRTIPEPKLSDYGNDSELLARAQVFAEGERRHLREARVSDMGVAVGVRNFLRLTLPNSARHYIDVYNRGLTRADWIHEPYGLHHDRAYLWYPEATPPDLPSIQVFTGDWEWWSESTEVRNMVVYIIYISGLANADKASAEHSLVVEGLTQDLKKPQKLIDDGIISDFRLESVATQWGMADELGYQVAGHDFKPRPTPIRETVFTCRALREDSIELVV